MTWKGLSPSLSMLKPYHNPMLAHQFFERFGLRGFIQEQFLKKPIVPPDVMMKSEVVLPKNDVFEDILRDNTASEVESCLPDTDLTDTDLNTVEVSAVEFKKPAVKFEFNWGRLRSLKSPITGVDLEFKAEFGETSTDPGTDYQDIGGDADTLVASADVGGGFEGG